MHPISLKFLSLKHSYIFWKKNVTEFNVQIKFVKHIFLWEEM